MKNLRYIPFFLLSLFCTAILAQETATLTGTVSLAGTTATQQFVNVAIKGTNVGSTTGKDGRFTITVPAGKTLVILFSFVGYETDSVAVRLNPGEQRTVNRTLLPVSTQLGSIEVKDQQLRTNTFSRIDPKALTFIPTINASVEDLIKTMPGVSSHNELSSQYSVRGGNYDENLVFVNDIEIYRPFLVRSGQQEGQSSPLPDLVSGISFSAGSVDAKYGDKMSSVLDIKYKKPTEFGG